MTCGNKCKSKMKCDDCSNSHKHKQKRNKKRKGKIIPIPPVTKEQIKKLLQPYKSKHKKRKHKKY